jgi:hypothetical protein
MWTDAPNVFARTPAAPELIADDYAFSPDGSQVVYSHATAPAPGQMIPNQPVELFVMNADGSGIRQLTHDDAYAAFPAWSPDGQTIAYASYRGQDYVPGCVGLSNCPSNLYLIDASGGEPTPLVSTTASETSPTWSPDSTRIAFAETNDGQGSIVSVKRGGSGRIEFSPGGAVSFPAWSPDGTQILFFRMQDGTNHVWSVTPDDSGHHDIVDTRTDTNFGRPVWSPDGTTIAFARPFAGATAVWTIDRYGNTPPERIAGWPGIDGAPIAWRPGPSGSDTDPALSESSGSPSVATDPLQEAEILDHVPPRSFSGVPIAGSPLSQDEFHGRSVIVVAWASWCEPCVSTLKEAQFITERARLYPAVVGVVQPEDVENARMVAANLGLTFPTIADDFTGAAFQALPTVWVLTPEGEVITTHVGSVDREWMLAAVYDATFGHPFSPTASPQATQEPVQVPNVVGMGSNAALQALDAEGLESIAAYREVEGAELGHVVSTDPAPGASVDAGTRVGVVVATRVTVLPDQAVSSLACGVTDAVAFGGPRLVLLPSGETFIRANVPGIERSDKVARATDRATDEGLWNIVRNGDVIAVIDYDTLDGVACTGTGVAGA